MGAIENMWVIINPTMTKPWYFSGMDGALPLMLPLGAQTRQYKRECDANSAIARIHDACGWDCKAVFAERIEYPDEPADGAPAAQPPAEPKPETQWTKMCAFGKIQMLVAVDGIHYAVRDAGGGYRLYDNALVAWDDYCNAMRDAGRERLTRRVGG